MPDSPETLPPALPAGTVPPASAEPGVPAHLEGLAETARNYARGAKAANTRRAYAADSRHFAAWCRRKDLDALPPDPEVIGLYLADCASETPLPRPQAGLGAHYRAAALGSHLALCAGGPALIICLTAPMVVDKADAGFRGEMANKGGVVAEVVTADR